MSECTFEFEKYECQVINLVFFFLNFLHSVCHPLKTVILSLWTISWRWWWTKRSRLNRWLWWMTWATYQVSKSKSKHNLHLFTPGVQLCLELWHPQIRVCTVKEAILKAEEPHKVDTWRSDQTTGSRSNIWSLLTVLCVYDCVYRCLGIHIWCVSVYIDICTQECVFGCVCSN